MRNRKLLRYRDRVYAASAVGSELIATIEAGLRSHEFAKYKILERDLKERARNISHALLMKFDIKPVQLGEDTKVQN